MSRDVTVQVVVARIDKDALDGLVEYEKNVLKDAKATRSTIMYRMIRSGLIEIARAHPELTCLDKIREEEHL